VWAGALSTSSVAAGWPSQREQAASVRLGSSDSAREGSSQRSGVGYFEVAFKCCDRDCDLVVLSSETTNCTVDDREVKVSFIRVGTLAADQTETRIGGAIQ